MADTKYVNLTGGSWGASVVYGESLADVLARAAVEVAKLEALPPWESVAVRLHHNIDNDGVHDITIITEGFMA